MGSKTTWVQKRPDGPRALAGLGKLKYLMDLPTSSDDFAVRIEIQGKALAGACYSWS